ncbi:hypoxanthine phosphoribosyltransferase [Candidatus Uhrbacteria bacterium]|nr:hypoxanthine phosphoribosyltransferase [Candidatus Uhrbacteria bacterium]
MTNILFSEEEIQARVLALAQEISTDFRGKDIVLVGLLKGAFMFVRDLGVALERLREAGGGIGDIYIDFLSVGSYDDGRESGTLKLDMDIRRSVKNCHVIVVEDTADTLNTLTWVDAHLRKKQPASLDICVLVRKPDKHRHQLDLRYVGFSREGLPFLGGYGLDVKGTRRCTPYIFEVSPE